MDIPAALIAAFPPAADFLLDRTRRDLDDAMLREIVVCTALGARLELLAPNGFSVWC